MNKETVAGTVIAVSAQCAMIFFAIRWSAWMRQSPHRTRSSSRRRGPTSDAGSLLSTLKSSVASPQPAERQTPPPPPEVSAQGPSQAEAFDLASLPILSSPDTTWRGAGGSDDYDPLSAIKTSRAALCASCTSCGAASPYSPTTSSMSFKTTVNQADLHLTELVKRIQSSPDSHIYWKELRAYLLAQREEERRHGVQLQTELPIVSFSEDADFVATQIEVRAMIAREPIRRGRSSNRSTPVTSTSPTPRTGRNLTARGAPGTARPMRSSSEDPQQSTGNSPTIVELEGENPLQQRSPQFSDEEDSEHLKALAKKLLKGKRRRASNTTGSPSHSLSHSGRMVIADALAELQVVEDGEEHDDAFNEDDDDDDDDDHSTNRVDPGNNVNSNQIKGLSQPPPAAASATATPPPAVSPFALSSDILLHSHLQQHVSSSPSSPGALASSQSHPTTYLYKQLAQLKQRTSFLKVAVDPANRMFLRELQAFEEQLRHAAERECPDLLHHTSSSSMLIDPLAVSTTSSVLSVASAATAPVMRNKQQPSRPIISASRHHYGGSASSPSSPSATTRSESTTAAVPQQKPIIPKISIGTVKRRAAAPDLNPEPNLDRFGRSASSSALPADDRTGLHGTSSVTANTAVGSEKFTRSHTDVSSVAIRPRRASHSGISASASSNATAAAPSKYHRIPSAAAVSTTTTK
ncbi:transmembrane protein, putative [Bodo saltans]|uniref:Transmembrane protein, putative n=1 Tax=Bodo saltans TaxID=75058 RepID=A0A0S4JKQ1_BODSA|nr:transmembrane protein, putative [Bodo saltans]|eukprot:CUG92117.1 transmembrane protein, putative [Bodo saltans]